MFWINFFVPFVVVLPLLLNVNQKFFPVMPGPKQLLTSQVADAGGAGGGDGVGDGEPYKKEIGWLKHITIFQNINIKIDYQPLNKMQQHIQNQYRKFLVLLW